MLRRVWPCFCASVALLAITTELAAQRVPGRQRAEADVHARLDEKMTTAFHTVHRRATDLNLHNRLAAYCVAVERVAEAVRLRGWV